jgi:hypothetical protein
MRDTSLGELTTDDTPRRPTVVAERIARKDLRNALFMKLRQLSPALFAVKKPVLLKWNLRRDCRAPRARREGRARSAAQTWFFFPHMQHGPRDPPLAPRASSCLYLKSVVRKRQVKHHDQL